MNKKIDSEFKSIKDIYQLQCICTELSDILEIKNKEIEKLTAESTKWESKLYDEAKKVDKAIEYIEKNSYTTLETTDDINYFIVRLDKCEDLLDILKGVDKE